ncbi:MAG: hypothetical protein EOP58_00015 [Sphingomonadales bacterium]|nr:MAG: hypothetical protein EOP58_00015 [Sphingomonadales bacterium]
MNRDFDGAAWADSHHHLGDAIGALFEKLAFAFRRLQAIQYDAPWERVRRRGKTQDAGSPAGL